MADEPRDKAKLDLSVQIEYAVTLLGQAVKAVSGDDLTAALELLNTASEKVTDAERSLGAVIFHEPGIQEVAEQSEPSWERFQRSILEVLVGQDGSARNWQVFEYVESHVELTDADKQPFKEGARETVWQHQCRMAGKRMREEEFGYLEPSTVQGVWTITDAGRAALEQLRKEG